MSYNLTTEEIAALRALHTTATAAEQQFQGALRFLITTHGMQQAELSADFSTLSPKEPQSS